MTIAERSKALHLPKSNIEIRDGLKSRLKTVAIFPNIAADKDSLDTWHAQASDRMLDALDQHA